MKGNYLARIINNSHLELSKCEVGVLVNLSIDGNDVYVYSAPYNSLQEVKVKMSLDEAKQYLTCVKKISTDVKLLYLLKFKK